MEIYKKRKHYALAPVISCQVCSGASDFVMRKTVKLKLLFNMQSCNLYQAMDGNLKEESLRFLVIPSETRALFKGPGRFWKYCCVFNFVTQMQR